MKMDFPNVDSTINNFPMKQLSKGPWIAKISILRAAVAVYENNFSMKWGIKKISQIQANWNERYKMHG